MAPGPDTSMAEHSDMLVHIVGVLVVLLMGLLSVLLKRAEKSLKVAIETLHETLAKSIADVKHAMDESIKKQYIFQLGLPDKYAPKEEIEKIYKVIDRHGHAPDGVTVREYRGQKKKDE
jgi:hypothetical protein